MNKDTVKGTFEQVSGKVKQAVGEVTGNQHLANAGTAEQVKGAARESWGNVKDTAHDVASSKHAQYEADTEVRKEQTADKANDIRAKVASTAQNAKENISEKLDNFKHKHAS